MNHESQNYVSDLFPDGSFIKEFFEHWKSQKMRIIMEKGDLVFTIKKEKQ